MKKIIAAAAAALALAAKNEIFTLLLLVAGAVWCVAILANGCQSRKHDPWSNEWEVRL